MIPSPSLPHRPVASERGRAFAACVAALALAGGLRAQSIAAGPWSGNVTPTSATVCAALSASGVNARVALSTSATLSNPIYSPAVSSSSAQGNAVRLEAGGLAPDTTYHYAVELNGVLQTGGDLRGTLRTHPAPGARSFKFSFGSCGAYDDPSQFVYQAIRDEAPLFFVHMGDMNYADVNSTNPENYRSAYTSQITLGGLRNLVRHVSTAYVWDDHDFAGNDSNRTSTGRTASRLVYRERVPHYPLPAGGPDAAIYQSFTVGRVRFILSDLRSERDPDSWPDDANKSMMGATQKQWFKNQLLAARDAQAPLIVWVSSVPFLSSSTAEDNWGSYTTERTELLTFIRDNNVKNLVVISGDMHALAVDDGGGTANYVAGVRVPIFHGAALARAGSIKGGPYTVNGATVTPSAGLGRYGNLIVNDTGTSLTATYEGRVASGSGGTLSGVSTWRTQVFTSESYSAVPLDTPLTITNRTHGLRLAVAADTQNNANVVAESPSAELDHQWQIVATDSGYFNLRNRKSAQWVNVSGGAGFAGANAATWPNNNTDDHYELRTIDAGGGFVKLQFRHSGLMLGSTGTLAGTNVQQDADGTSDRIRWQLVDQGNGHWKIVQRSTGLELALAADTQNNGNVVAEAASAELDHRWELEDAGEGWRFLRNVKSGMYLNVSGALTETDANIAQWPNGQSTHYQVRLVDTGGGYHNLVFRHSGKVLTALGTIAGTNVQQGGADGTSDRARWRFEP